MTTLVSFVRIPQSLAVASLEPMAKTCRPKTVDRRTTAMAAATPAMSQMPGATSALFGKLDAASTWAFLLQEQSDGSTRLIVRWRARWPLLHSPTGLAYGLLLDPIEFIMEQKMMRGIKERAEAAVAPIRPGRRQPIGGEE